MILDLSEFADRRASMKKPASIEQAEGAKNLPLIQFLFKSMDSLHKVYRFRILLPAKMTPRISGLSRLFA